jgi:hypothetical protein
LNLPGALPYAFLFFVKYTGGNSITDLLKAGAAFYLYQGLARIFENLSSPFLNF